MKSRTKNQLRNLLIGSLVLAASAPALALKSDSSQPVSIGVSPIAITVEAMVNVTLRARLARAWGS